MQIVSAGEDYFLQNWAVLAVSWANNTNPYQKYDNQISQPHTWLCSEVATWVGGRHSLAAALAVGVLAGGVPNVGVVPGAGIAGGRVGPRLPNIQDPVPIGIAARVHRHHASFDRP